MIRKADESRTTATKPKKSSRRRPAARRRERDAADAVDEAVAGDPGRDDVGRDDLGAVEAPLSRALVGDDPRALQGCMQEVSGYLSERLGRHLRAHHLAFDPGELLGDLLARMMLERSSFSGSLEEWIEAMAKAVVADRHRRTSRLLTREFRAVAIPVDGEPGLNGDLDVPAEGCSAGGAGSHGGVFGSSDLRGVAFDPEILAEALAVLPEGQRRCLEQIVTGQMRYVELAENLTLPESAVPPKIRRIRERMYELVHHLMSRDQRAARMTRQVRGVSDGHTAVSSSVR